MSNAKKFTGGCHCGNVRYEVTAELNEVTACNCSICSKRGHLLMFVGEDAFSLQSGKEMLTDYQFNTMNIHHLFCKVCGIGSFGTGKGPGGKTMFAINTRCLDDVDTTTLKVKNFDGKKL